MRTLLMSSHKEEGFEKLKVELMDSHTKMESLSKTFNYTKDAAETERLQQTINELKSRLEELEVQLSIIAPTLFLFFIYLLIPVYV